MRSAWHRRHDLAWMNAPPIDTAAIKRAAEVLRRGGIVALPTETVYGLAADAENEDAVRQLFAAKGRPADHPVIVHVSGADAFNDWAIEVPDAAHVLARAFWPGPLTLVLKRSARARDIVTGGQDTVGLRAPAHPWMRAVLHAFGGALAAPSANSFGRVSPTTAQHVIDDLGVKPRGKVDLVVDGGACPVGIESTIVDVCSDPPTLLRPGAITRDRLQHAIGRPDCRRRHSSATHLRPARETLRAAHATDGDAGRRAVRAAVEARRSTARIARASGSAATLPRRCCVGNRCRRACRRLRAPAVLVAASARFERRGPTDRCGTSGWAPNGRRSMIACDGRRPGVKKGKRLLFDGLSTSNCCTKRVRMRLQ